MMGLELRQEKPPQGRIPTFAHPTQHKTSQVHLLGRVSHRQQHLPLQRGQLAPGWLEEMEDLPAVSKRSRPQMENFALDLSTPSPLARPL